MKWLAEQKGSHNADLFTCRHADSPKGHSQAKHSYVPEPERGQRHWPGKAEEQRCVYGNRRRVRAERSKRLRKLRGELCERSFVHCYETGTLRRMYVRGQDIQAGAGAGGGVQHGAIAAHVERLGQSVRTEQPRVLLVNRPHGLFAGYRSPNQPVNVFHRLDLRFDSAHLTFTVPLEALSSTPPNCL